jgi:hypothetical protein
MFKINKLFFISSLMILNYSCFIPISKLPDYSKAKAIFLLSSNTTNADKIKIKIFNDTCVRGIVCEDNFEFSLSDAKPIYLYPGKNKITVIQFDKLGNKILEETKEINVSDTSTKIEINLQLNKVAIITDVTPSVSPTPTTTATSSPIILETSPSPSPTVEVSPTPTPFKERGGGGGGGGGGSAATPTPTATPPAINVNTNIISDETSVK